LLVATPKSFKSPRPISFDCAAIGIIIIIGCCIIGIDAAVAAFIDDAVVASRYSGFQHSIV